MSAHFILPTKPCHNCRKRRWKCDRSLPVCQKCLHSGSECLGYGKLLVWNQGVARRGKMMGKSFEDVEKTKKENQGHLVHQASKESPKNSLGVEIPRTESDFSSSQDLVKGERADMRIQWPLIDPLVKDMGRQSRYYLYHFATQLCADMVVVDGPGQNPIRDLVPATSGNPLLLQVMLANAALHVYNISSEPAKPSIYQPDRKLCLVAYYGSVSRFGGPFTTSYRDALVAKQQALSHLSQSVAFVNPSNIDFILAAILLFINFDLVESGKDKWKVHMDGATKLISLLGTPPYEQNPMSQLRKCLLADFLVFFILGSTLNFYAGPKKLLPDTIDVEPILQYAETNNYLSCPGPLLRVMLESFDLPDLRETKSIPTKVQDQVQKLLESALAFDPVKWATRDFRPASPFEDLEKRALIASAHKAAVCIYVARVLPAGNPLLNPIHGTALVSLTGLADEVVYNISCIKPGDTVFKCICWPLFLAGAESEDLAQRAYILQLLDAQWNEMYWGYICTVQNVLEAIWSYRELYEELDDYCWVDDVKKMGTELLIA
ncbi:hypothetical protein CC78DRAFT_613999 [Lojkania enalia]|uniref:Zn(2)-C6 fungal-type domain-containing protein n=1 Tax=Lojkania enalia TaxID=147567 RepID=A0A9P4N6J5_9PLEO|nr:hypothetical protein CC78DRAFT_613999 [Didymosphaeria enalia]